jgi:hypothetical protein
MRKWLSTFLVFFILSGLFGQGKKWKRVLIATPIFGHTYGPYQSLFIGLSREKDFVYKNWPAGIYRFHAKSQSITFDYNLDSKKWSPKYDIWFQHLDFHPIIIGASVKLDNYNTFVFAPMIGLIFNPVYAFNYYTSTIESRAGRLINYFRYVTRSRWNRAIRLKIYYEPRISDLGLTHHFGTAIYLGPNKRRGLILN